MMCISDLNPQMQFRPLNTEEYRKIINIPIRIHHKEPALETPTGTPHLAATRPPRAARAVTKSWTQNWLTPENWFHPTTSTGIWSLSHTTQTTSMYTIGTTSIQELGVTRSYEEDPNIIIHRFEVEAL